MSRVLITRAFLTAAFAVVPVALIGHSAQAQITRPETTIKGDVYTNLNSSPMQTNDINDNSVSQGTSTYSDTTTLVTQASNGTETSTIKATTSYGTLKSYASSMFPATGYNKAQTSANITSTFYDTLTNVSASDQTLTFSMYLNASASISSGSANVLEEYNVETPLGGTVVASLAEPANATNANPNPTLSGTATSTPYVLAPGQSLDFTGELYTYSEAGYGASGVADASDTGNFYFFGETPGSITTLSGYDYSPNAAPTPEASTAESLGIMAVTGFGSLALASRRRRSAAGV